MSDKKTLNNIIAKDIINYGIDEAMFDNQTLSMIFYLRELDEDTEKYVLDNIKEIVENISNDEKIKELKVFEDEYGKHLHITFYWEYLLNPFEKKIFDCAEEQRICLDLDSIRDIEKELLENNIFDINIRHILKSRDKGRDFE